MLKLTTDFLSGAWFPTVIRFFVFGSALGLVGGNLWAADLQVQVVEQGEESPLEKAAVCLGTSADRQQFGAYYSDEKGRVWFHGLEIGPFILTVSKPGFRGEQRIVGRQWIERVMVVTLAPGGGGPVCKVPAEAKIEAPTVAELRVQDFTINQGAPMTLSRKVSLTFTVEGEPTEYRISQFPDFRDAQWQVFVPTPQFELSPGSGKKTVYLQVRRYRKKEDSHLQMVSNVIKDSIYFSDD